MTPEREQELRALCEAATPGGWRHVDDGHGHQIGVRGLGIPRATVYLHADAAFIAAARSALPEILDEMARLRARRPVVCPACEGDPTSGPLGRCDTCGGTGAVWQEADRG